MKNRDYTGLVRTPSSMAWLIAQRARVKGQLDRLRRQQGTLPERIQTAEAELASLDAVIPLHEVNVDPSVIAGRHRRSRSGYRALEVVCRAVLLFGGRGLRRADAVWRDFHPHHCGHL